MGIYIPQRITLKYRKVTKERLAITNIIVVVVVKSVAIDFVKVKYRVTADRISKENKFGVCGIWVVECEIYLQLPPWISVLSTCGIIESHNFAEAYVQTGSTVLNT